MGETIAVSIDLESREYNGRWYTDVKAWKVSRDDDGSNFAQSVDNQNKNEPTSNAFTSLNEDDIPF